MKINKKALKFKREGVYIEKVFNKIFENFDYNKAQKISGGYQYDKVKIWKIYYSDIGWCIDIKINDEKFEDEVSIGWKTLQRLNDLNILYNKFEKLYNESKESKRENFINAL